MLIIAMTNNGKITVAAKLKVSLERIFMVQAYFYYIK